jgi:hypothetical protein
MIALKISEVIPVAPQKIISGVSQEIVTISLVPSFCELTNQEVEPNQEILDNQGIVAATSKQRPEGTGTSASVERNQRYRRKKRSVNTLFTVEEDLREEEKALGADKGTPPQN